MTCPRSESPLRGGERTQGLSDPRAHCLSSEAAASLCMASLTLEGCPTQPQSTRGHLAKTCVTDGAAKAEATGTSPPGQLAGGAAAPEEASATFCSRGPAGGKRESTQVSAGPAPPVPNTWRSRGRW